MTGHLGASVMIIATIVPRVGLASSRPGSGSQLALPNLDGVRPVGER
jgi:hypothetical protein